MKEVLKQVGFYGKMIGWIMKIQQATSFPINVNGECCGYFKGSRGLRQGDPL